MNIPKSLMAILLAVALTFSVVSLSNATYAAETQVGADLITTADDDTAANEAETQKDTASTEMPSELKAAFNEAIKSITALNKVEALGTAINSTSSIPKFDDLLAIENAIYQVKGFSSLESLEANWEYSEEEISARNQLIDAIIATDGKANEATEASLQSKTFLELIDLAKTNDLYSEEIIGTPPSVDGNENDESQDEVLNFSTLVNQCQSMYNQGVTTLNILLPAVVPSTTAIQNMNGEALASLATTATEYDSYGFYAANALTIEELEAEAEKHVWELFPSYLHAARIWFQNQGKDVSSYNTDSLTSAYGRLVAVAKSIDPEFTVDLSSVTRLTTLPTLPNTGSLADGESSASMVAIALGGIAATVTLAGLGLTAKRFLFSPLKRRR